MLAVIPGVLTLDEQVSHYDSRLKNMAILRALFGPSQEEVWRELCRQIKADYVQGGFWNRDKVQAHFRQWTITLDTYTESHGKSRHTYTRMRAPYINADNFYFRIYRTGIFTGIGKFFGMQDIEIGDRWFDDEFVIQANDESRAIRFFSNQRIRELIRRQTDIHLTVKDDEGWFGASFPDGVDELCFTVSGVVMDIEQLKSMFELFAVSLNMLCHMGSAYENDPHLEL
jgi:hypothetical protein